MNPKWSRISLAFLLVVAMIGTWLRSLQLLPLPFEYRNLVHAHSHVAFQGWVYTLLFLLITSTYLTREQIENGKYPLQFKLTILVIIGVLISFVAQGYGVYSIVCSTLFQLLNYWFIYQFLRDVRFHKSTLSLRFIRIGMLIGVLSTLLPFAIGIVAAKGLKGTELYQSLIYTFLHLQYNGWFLFVLLGLLIHQLEKHVLAFDRRIGFQFFRLMAIAVLPAIALSLLGMSFANWVKWIAYFAVALQLAALYYFVQMLLPAVATGLNALNGWTKMFLISGVLFFGVKLLLQGLSVVPFFSSYAFQNQPIILAYLHMSLIGVISFTLIALLLEKGWISLNVFSKIGLVTLFAGFLSTEVALVMQGLGIYSSPIYLSIGSGVMMLGILFLLCSPNQLSSTE